MIDQLRDGAPREFLRARKLVAWVGAIAGGVLFLVLLAGFGSEISSTREQLSAGQRRAQDLSVPNPESACELARRPTNPPDRYVDILHEIECEEERRAGGPEPYLQAQRVQAATYVAKTRSKLDSGLTAGLISLVLTAGTTYVVAWRIPRISDSKIHSLSRFGSRALPAALVILAVYVAASTLRGEWLEESRPIALAMAAALGFWAWRLTRSERWPNNFE